MPEPDPLVAAATALSSLLLAEESLESTLQRVATLADLAVADCMAAGVTLLRRDRWSTGASTVAWLPSVDQGQYDLDDGPCLRAAREQRTVLADEEELQTHWVPFYRDALSHDVRSVLALPLRSGDGLIGALNLYSALSDGFADLSTKTVDLYAAQASVALANSLVYDGALRLTVQLQEALNSRAMIEQAKGYLMARQDIDPDEAFATLRRESQRTNRKLRDVALEVLGLARG